MMFSSRHIASETVGQIIRLQLVLFTHSLEIAYKCKRPIGFYITLNSVQNLNGPIA